MRVECWNCGTIVEPNEWGSCPNCGVQFPRFILGIRILDEPPHETEHKPHPDPIKRKEAELAAHYYHWIYKEFISEDSILRSDFTLPEQEPSPILMPTPPPIRQQTTPRSVTGPAYIPAEERRCDAVYKIVAMGEMGSGKTEILNAYLTGTFDRDYRQTLGFDVRTHDTQINNQLFKLLIWNLAGQDRFRDLRIRYCQGSSGGLLFFDCTRPQTLQATSEWVEAFHEAVGPEPPLYLIGAKADMTQERQVPPEAARTIVKELRLSRYYEIPNTHQEFITAILDTLALQMHQHHTTRRGSP